MTLDEVIREARRLDDAATFADRGSIPWEEFADTNARVDAFYAEHGPRLARVAERAMALREMWDEFVDDMDERIAAFDRASRGDE